MLKFCPWSGPWVTKEDGDIRITSSITRMPVPRPQCQFTNNKSKVLEERKIKFIIHQTKRRTGRVILSKLCCPTSERKCLLFKGEFRGSV
jgi:hypothetical protein